MVAPSSVHDRLIAFLADRARAAQDVNDSTPLLTSGLLDSLALIELVLWIEQEVGMAIDPELIIHPTAAVNTVGEIVDLIAAHQR